MSEVRIATLADRDAMIDFLRVAHSENGVAPLSEAKMLRALDRGLARDLSVIGIIATPNRVMASIGLYCHEWWYSERVFWEDFWNFVRPDHRKSTYANDLLDFSKMIAVSLEMDLLIGVLSEERTEAKVHMYQRKFGKPKGAAFLYRGSEIAAVSATNAAKMAAD
jgi:hypothetical protein